MKVEIKNLKVAEFASQETLCFNCSVWVDGKRVATGENDGHGGMSFYRFSDRDAESAIKEHVATLPEVEIEGGGFSYKQSADSWLDDFVYKKHEEIKFARLTRGKILFRIKSDTYESGQYLAIKSQGGIREYLNDKYGADGWVQLASMDELAAVQ